MSTSTDTGTGTGATPADPGNPYNLGAGTPTSPQPNDPRAIQVTVNGRSSTIELVKQLTGDTPLNSKLLLSSRQRGRAGGFDEASDTVASKLAEITDWYGNATKRSQMIQQMYAAGLVTSKKSPSAAEVATAWALVVQEAALQNQAGQPISPEDLLAKAAKSGWNSIGATLTPDASGAVGTGNLNNAADASTTTSQTIYKSYLDPATIMGAQADAWFRLMGRNPTQAEYNAFLNSVLQYQDASNTGKFESQTKDPSDKVTGDTTSSGQPVGPQGTPNGSMDPTTSTSIVSQRGIGTRGLQFLAGQAALANPEEGAYQAATTYFNAFIKALSGPAAGMQASGPTTTVP